MLEWFLKETGVMILKIKLCHHRNKLLHFKTVILNVNNIPYYCFDCITDQINANLESTRGLQKKTLSRIVNNCAVQLSTWKYIFIRFL